MDEDNTPQELEAPVETPQHTDIELKALEMGWRPKDEFSGTEDEFIDAKEFVRRKPLFDRIEQQSRELKQIKRAMDAFKEHNTKMEEVAVQKAIQQLKSARKEALSAGDGDQFELFDDEIKKAESQLVEIKQAKNTPAVEEAELHPEFAQWTNRNPWYKDSSAATEAMRVYADSLGNKLAAKGLTPKEVLEKVEVAVKQEFPHKFRNPNKENAPAVAEGKKVTSAPASNKDEGKLNDFQRKVMNDLVRQGVLTKEKYIADLKAIGEI